MSRQTSQRGQSKSNRKSDYGAEAKKRNSRSARSVETFLQSLMDEGRTKNDKEGVSYTVSTVFQYMAANTKYFSEKRFPRNVKKLNEKLESIQETWAEKWRREMFIAVQTHDLKAIKNLIKVHGFNIDGNIGPIVKVEECKNAPKDHTSMTWASFKGDLALVKNLIDLGANPKAPASQGMTPIHFCCIRNEGLSALKFFIEQLGIDVNLCNEKNGATPLMYACFYGVHPTTEYLLEFEKVKVNQQDNKGLSALFYAAKGGHLDIIKLLVSKRAYVPLRDDSNANVIHHLLNAHNQIPDKTIHNILVYLVEDQKLSVEDKKNNDCTPLHIACRLGLVETAKFILDHARNRKQLMETKMNGWETPVWSLAKSSTPNKKIIQLLLNYGETFDRIHPTKMTLVEFVALTKKDALVDEFKAAIKISRNRQMEKLRNERRKLLTGIDNVIESSNLNANKPVLWKSNNVSDLKVDGREEQSSSIYKGLIIGNGNKEDGLSSISSNTSDSEIEDTPGNSVESMKMKLNLPPLTISISSSSEEDSGSESESSCSDEGKWETQTCPQMSNQEMDRPSQECSDESDENNCEGESNENGRISRKREHDQGRSLQAPQMIKRACTRRSGVFRSDSE